MPSDFDNFMGSIGLKGGPELPATPQAPAGSIPKAPAPAVAPRQPDTFDDFMGKVGLKSAIPAQPGTGGPPAFAPPKIPDLKDRSPLKLAPEEEQKFQSFVKGTQWHKEFQPRYGEEPNLNDPNYDLRRAWKAGVIPQLASDKTY